MKKVSVILFLILTSFGLASAQSATDTRQDVKTPEERAEAMTKRLTKELGLNEAQATQVQSIYLAQAQKMQELKAEKQESEDKVAMRTEAKAALAETDQKLRTVLTAEQYNQYEQMKQERRENRTDRTGPRKRRRG